MASKISILPRRGYILVDAPAPRPGTPRHEIRARSFPEAYRIAGDIAADNVRAGFTDVEIHDEKGNVFLPHEFQARSVKSSEKRAMKAPGSRVRLGHAGGSKERAFFSSYGGLFGVIYEVRSGANLKENKMGVLEGVFKKASTAREYADALKGVGARGVVTIPVDANKAAARHAEELARTVRERFHHRAGYSRGRANRDGVTWVEWTRRAGLGEHDIRDRHYLAWVAAEDPVKWRPGTPHRAPVPHHATRDGHSMGKTLKRLKKQAHSRVKRAYASAEAETRCAYASAEAKAKKAIASAKAKARNRIVEEACNICDAGKGKRIRGAR